MSSQARSLAHRRLATHNAPLLTVGNGITQKDTAIMSTLSFAALHSRVPGLASCRAVLDHLSDLIARIPLPIITSPRPLREKRCVMPQVTPCLRLPALEYLAPVRRQKFLPVVIERGPRGGFYQITQNGQKRRISQREFDPRAMRYGAHDVSHGAVFAH